jgi:transcriptional regulator with XRE-family HTH domain
MAHIDDLYDAFVRAWHDGLAPDAATYLAKAPDAERDELAGMIGTFVAVAPSVAPTPERAAETADDPVFVRAMRLVDDLEPTTWGARLSAARARAGLSLAELGDRFAASFGLRGREARAAALLGRLESGDLEPAGVSERAAARLAELLGQAADALRPPPAAAALFRADDAVGENYGDVLMAAAAALEQRDGEPWDELDDLLRGGDDPDGADPAG